MHSKIIKINRLWLNNVIKIRTLKFNLIKRSRILSRLWVYLRVFFNEKIE